MRNAQTILVAVLATCLPAAAQNYHYSYGGGRVVNQNQTGLYMPAGTQIGAGTMSQSARGLPAGVGSGGMSGLPQTKMGANVGTPGDNQYTDAAQYERHIGNRRRMPAGRMGANIGMPGDNMRSDLHYYVPGQNAGGTSVRQGQFYAPAPRWGNQGGQSVSPSTYAESEGNYNVGRNGAYHY